MLTSSAIFIVIISLLVFNVIFNLWLDYLNHLQYYKPLPNNVKDVYDQSKIKSQWAYHKANYSLELFSSSVSFVVTLLVLFFNILPLIDDFVTSNVHNTFLRSALFLGIIGALSQVLSIPFSLYDVFVIEQRFGFNKTTVKTYFLDMIKSLVISILIGGLLLFVIIWFWQVTGSWFWFFSWIIFASFSVFMMLFYSSLIVPIFNKQNPLEEGELRLAIEGFAKQVNFSVNNIFVIDASKRSAKTNAYFSGWGSKKRIVLYDTLIEKHSTEEIVAILAHEIGHYKNKHTILGAVMSIFSMGLLLFIFGLFINYPIFSQALGFSSHSFHSSLIAFAFLIEPLTLITGLISSIISRRFEYQADKFVVDHRKGATLANALRKLSSDNLSNINPHPWYVFFNYSHPPMHLRLKQLEN